MQFEPNTIGTLAAIAAVIVAGASFVVAFQQHQTAQAKLNLDLFEKRFRLFETCMGILAEANIRGKWSYDSRLEFRRQIPAVRCLFPSEVAAKLKQLAKVGDDMEDDRFRAEQAPQGSQEQREALQEAHQGSNFIDLYAIGSLFEKHMRILPKRPNE